jgi:hypothetical protein
MSGVPVPSAELMMPSFVVAPTAEKRTVSRSDAAE